MAAKKTTKKTAKKTYQSTRTPPKPRRITVDELSVIVADLAENHAKTEAAIRELSAENRKTSAENRKIAVENRKIAVEVAENHAKTEAAIQELSAENRKTSAEVRETSAEIRETGKVLKETLRSVERLSAEVSELTKNSSRLGNDVGALTEYIVIPKIRLAMNAAGGYTFDNIQTGRKFRKVDEHGEKKIITEVDVLLSGKTEIMAVETKSCLMMRDVKKHMDRLDILRKNEELVGIEGKPLLGAVVGAIVDEDVKNFALKRGLYVAKIREEEEKLEITKPETCRTW